MPSRIVAKLGVKTSLVVYAVVILALYMAVGWVVLGSLVQGDVLLRLDRKSVV